MNDEAVSADRVESGELVIVLVRPIYPGNIGAVLRAAANFSATEVRVVQPEADLDDPDLRKMAMGARQHVDLRTFGSLDLAIQDASLVVATTSARARDPRGVLEPSQLRSYLSERPSRRTALVFGPERSGLTHAELHRAHMLATIPSNPAAPVLNLSQAVVVLLSWLTDLPATPKPVEDPMDQPAPFTELSAGLDHLEEALSETRFLDADNPARVMDQIRRWVGRSAPTRREIAVLRGIASHLLYIWRRESTDGSEPSSS